MTNIDIETAVTEMLNRRADDITTATPPDVSSLHPTEIPPPARRAPRRWLAVAAVVVAAVAVASVLRTDRSGTTDVATESTNEHANAGADLLEVSLAIRQRPGPEYPNGSVSVLTARDPDDEVVVGPLLEPAGEVMDPESAPGSAGRDRTSGFARVAVPRGATIEVGQLLCEPSGCPTEPPDLEIIATELVDVCRLVADGSVDAGEVTMEFTPTQGCGYIGPPTQAHLEAATDLLMRQQETGWVPYGGDPAIGDVEVPEEAWIRDPGATGGQPCVRPASLPIEGPQVSCIYDKPEGSVIGYHLSNLGYVPAGRIAEVDPDQQFLDNWGCIPYRDEDCGPPGIEDLESSGPTCVESSSGRWTAPIGVTVNGPDGSLQGDEWEITVPPGGSLPLDLTLDLPDARITQLEISIASDGLVTPIRHYPTSFEWTPGQHQQRIVWDRRDDAGEIVRAGRYLLRFEVTVECGEDTQGSAWSVGSIHVE